MESAERSKVVRNVGVMCVVCNHILYRALELAVRGKRAAFTADGVKDGELFEERGWGISKCSVKKLLDVHFLGVLRPPSRPPIPAPAEGSVRHWHP